MEHISDEEMLKRMEHFLYDCEPETPEEVDAFLRAEGIDPDLAAARMRQFVNSLLSQRQTLIDEIAYRDAEDADMPDNATNAPWHDPQLDQIIAALDAAGVPRMAGGTPLRVQWLVGAWQRTHQRAELMNDIASHQSDIIEDTQQRVRILRQEVDRMGGDSAQMLRELREEA